MALPLVAAGVLAAAGWGIYVHNVRDAETSATGPAPSQEAALRATWVTFVSANLITQVGTEAFTLFSSSDWATGGTTLPAGTPAKMPFLSETDVDATALIAMDYLTVAQAVNIYVNAYNEAHPETPLGGIELNPALPAPHIFPRDQGPPKTSGR